MLMSVLVFILEYDFVSMPRPRRFAKKLNQAVAKSQERIAKTNRIRELLGEQRRAELAEDRPDPMRKNWARTANEVGRRLENSSNAEIKKLMRNRKWPPIGLIRRILAGPKANYRLWRQKHRTQSKKK